MADLDILGVALQFEQKQRELDEVMNHQRELIAETLLLCQAYVDTFGEEA